MEGWFKKIKMTKNGKRIFELKTDEETTKIPLDEPIFQMLSDAFNSNKEKIFSELSDKWEMVRTSLKKEGGSGVVLTMGVVDEDKDIRYLGDFSEFRKFLIDCKISRLKEIRKEKHTCSICSNADTEVYGNAISDIFKFYTLDKEGYIAGGFQRQQAWKNFPLCLNCTLLIEEGRDFLDSYLQFSMAGNQYYLIPKFILGIEEAPDIVEDFFTISTQPKETLSSIKRISEDEKEIIEELGKLKDILTYNFMFFERQKGSPAVHRIHLLVEDVLPSRISKIFEAKRETEKHEIFKDVKTNKKKYENIEFRFDTFRRFTPSQKEFLEVVDKAFRGTNLESNILFSWFMETIRQGFINELYLKPLVLQAFVSLLFFKKLEIIRQHKAFKEGGKLMTELKDKAESFFAGFPETFITAAHKSVFLLGVLTQKLLDIQRREREATPFRKHLRGLKMQEEDLKVLLPKIQNKLEEYGKNYYHSLESLISAYFLEAGRNWRVSTDELNFYFVLGMNLKNEVDKALALKKEKEDENVGDN
jgi:CRISPR-associated protein Csh1